MINSECITVVTGLPRSGTSMLMRMLAAGGLPLLVDEARPPDEHNPHGYHEFALVARTKSDATWVPQARGRVVKVVSYLVPHLPIDEQYRFVCLSRDIAEVLASQDRMLRKAHQAPDDRLTAVFLRQDALAEAWLNAHRVPRLAVQFGAVHRDPVRAAQALAEFLGGGLDTVAMAATVDTALYRNRSA